MVYTKTRSTWIDRQVFAHVTGELLAWEFALRNRQRRCGRLLGRGAARTVSAMNRIDGPERSDSALWRGRALSRVRPIAAGGYRVDLEGPLRPGWMASLGLELAALNISIDRAVATRGAKGVWNAEIDIVQMAGGADPLQLPYVHLAETNRSADASPPLALSRYTLIESPAHGGCLELAFEADDALGLLGRVLADLALLVLFPVELRIETSAGRVHDKLWLGGINGSAPPREARMRLEQRLDNVLALGDDTAPPGHPRDRRDR